MEIDATANFPGSGLTHPATAGSPESPCVRPVSSGGCATERTALRRARGEIDDLRQQLDLLERRIDRVELSRAALERAAMPEREKEAVSAVTAGTALSGRPSYAPPPIGDPPPREIIPPIHPRVESLYAYAQVTNLATLLDLLA